MTANSDPMGHIYLDFHYISICRKKKKKQSILNAICCTAKF